MLKHDSWPSSVDPAVVRALTAAGHRTPGQVLLNVHDTQLAQLLNVSVFVARDILSSIADALAPPSSTALEIVVAAQQGSRTVSTPLNALTEALSGGFAPTVYEFAGPAGAGKTQWALTCAATMLVAHEAAMSAAAALASAGSMDRKYVAYIDTEGAFDPGRLEQIITERLVAAGLLSRSELDALRHEGSGLVSAGAAASIDSADFPATAPSQTDGSGGKEDAHSLVHRLLGYVVVHRADSVAAVQRICASLPHRIPIAQAGAGAAVQGLTSPIAVAKAVSHPDAATPAAAVLPAQAHLQAQARLGMLIIDSIAAASRQEFDAAAGGGAGAGGSGGGSTSPSGGLPAAMPAGRSTSPSGLLTSTAAAAAPGGRESGGSSGGGSEFSAWARADALTRLSATIKGLCEACSAPIIVTNQIATAVPPSKLIREAAAAAAAGGSSRHDDGSDSFASWAGAWLEETLVPALGPIWAHSVNVRFYLQSRRATAGAAAAAAAGAGRGSSVLTSSAVMAPASGVLTIVKSPATARHSFGYSIGPAGIMDDAL